MRKGYSASVFRFVKKGHPNEKANYSYHQLREIAEKIISRLQLHCLTYEVRDDKVICRKTEGSMQEFAAEVYALFEDLKRDLGAKYKVTGDDRPNPRILDDGSMSIKVSLAGKSVVPIAPNMNPNKIMR